MFELNTIKDKLKRGEIVVGANVLFADPDISELYGYAGCDFVWIDAEHAPLSNKDIEQHIIAAHAGNSVALVRLPWNDMVMAKQVLDMGPDGIIIPLIRSAEEAEKAIQFCSYPPRGVRGWNPIRAVKYGCVDSKWYIENVDSLTWKVLMIEHIDAVNDIENILAVPGVDAIMIGPSDLTGSMGCLLQTGTEEFWKIIEHVTDAAKKADKAIGVALPANCPEDYLKKWISYGVQWVAVGQDANFMVQIVQDNVNAAKNIYKKYHSEL